MPRLPFATTKTKERRNNGCREVSEREQKAFSDPFLLAKCSSAEARDLITFKDACKLKILPLALTSLTGRRCLTVAAHELDAEAARAAKFICNLELRAVCADAEAIERAIHIAYKGDEKLLLNRLSALDSLAAKTSAKELPRAEAIGPVPQFIETLLDYAFSRGASDIHITPRRDGTFISLRVDGALLNHDKPLGPLGIHNQLISRLKVMSKLDITEKNNVQEATLPVQIGADEINYRLSLVPTVHGERAVLRLHGARRLYQLSELGLSPQVLSSLDEYIAHPVGVAIVCGATGSGKTTTAYSIAAALHKQGLNLTSIEDPVEIILPEFSQCSIDAKRGLDYATCLKAVLRQDPDAIMVGEIRDADCCKMVFKAAQTGHPVISTLHCGSLPGALIRLADLGMSCLTLAQSLKLIVFQRLVPKLCEHCKVIDLEICNLLNSRIFKEVGCADCGYSGILGRASICDVLTMNDAMAASLIENGLAEGLSKIKTAKTHCNQESELNRLLKNGIISYRSYQRFGGTL